MSQLCTSCFFASLIQNLPASSNFVLQRRPNAAEKIELCTRAHNDILRHVNTAQTSIGQNRSIIIREVTLTNNYHQVDVAELVRRSPGMRTE